MMTGVAATIDGFLEGAGIAFKRVSDTTWALQLRGEHKLTIPVLITVVDDRLTFESFFMRAPLQNQDRFYDLLLRRNMRSYGVHFALDVVGDVYVVGQRACAGIDEAELDRIIGAILIEADGMFDAAIGIGFESYLAADLAWRARDATEAT